MIWWTSVCPNNQTVQSVFVTDYTVDCLGIRSRERLGMVAESRIRGIGTDATDPWLARDGGLSGRIPTREGGREKTR